MFSLQRIKCSTWQQLAIPVGLALLALLAFCFDNRINYFDFYRLAISEGEYWRLLTGHLFHTNGTHLLLNLLGLALITALHRHFYQPLPFATLTLFSALFISGFLILIGGLDRYVGLSGLLHSFFAWGALKDMQAKEKTGVFLYLGLWVKVLLEQTQGASEQIASLINANVAIDAHLGGAIAGTLCFALGLIARRLQSTVDA